MSAGTGTFRRAPGDPVVEFQLSRIWCAACARSFQHRSLLVTEEGPKCAYCDAPCWPPGVWRAAVAVVRSGEPDAGFAVLAGAS